MFILYLVSQAVKYLKPLSINMVIIYPSKYFFNQENTEDRRKMLKKGKDDMNRATLI